MGDAATPMAGAVNPDLAMLHSELIALVVELDAAVGRAKDASEVTGLLDEISEVNARITNVGRQLFTQQTVKITAGVAKVTAAKGEALAAVKKLESVKSVIQAVTKFLSLVDNVVGIAKLVI